MIDDKYFIDDRCIIPEDIEKMTPDEVKAEIRRLEAERAEELKRKNVVINEEEVQRRRALLRELYKDNDNSEND